MLVIGLFGCGDSQPQIPTLADGSHLAAVAWLHSRKSWAESTADEEMKAKRDPVGNGGVARVLWEIRSAANDNQPELQNSPKRTGWRVERIDFIVGIVGVVASFGAAAFWLWASLIKVPDNMDTFIQALQHAGRINSWTCACIAAICGTYAFSRNIRLI
jgi:hypothetical protein